MPAALKPLLAMACVVLLGGCTSGLSGISDPALPAHGQQLFSDGAADTGFATGTGQQLVLTRVGDEALAVYATTRSSSAAPGSYALTTFDVLRGTSGGSSWQRADFYKDPLAKRIKFYGEKYRLRSAAQEVWVHSGTTNDYPVFFSASKGAWVGVTDFTDDVDCVGAADEAHARVYLACRDYRFVRIDARGLGEASEGRQAQLELQSKQLLAAVDPKASAPGAVFVVALPQVKSDPLTLLSVDGALEQLKPVMTPVEPARRGTIPQPCEGCAFEQLKGYLIAGETHHLVVETTKRGEPRPALWHFAGKADGSFDKTRLDVDDAGHSRGSFRAVQPPIGDEPLQLVLELPGSCLQVLSWDSVKAAWQRRGALPLAKDLAAREHGAVVWPDGDLGFAAGDHLIDYYHGALRADWTCEPPSEPTDDGGVDGSSATPYETDGNLIQITRTPQKMTVKVEPGGVNPICSAGYSGTTGEKGCNVRPKKETCEASTEPFEEGFGLGSFCYSLMLTVTFTDSKGLGPSIDLGRVEGVKPTPTCVDTGNPQPCDLLRGQSLDLSWPPATGWDGVRIVVESEDKQVLLDELTDDDGAHTLPASTFAAVKVWRHAAIVLERYRAVPFDFPVAEGSFARQVISDGTAIRIIEEPTP